MRSIMLKFRIICCFVFLVLDHANSDSCVPEAIGKAEKCRNQWGYSDLKGFNFTTMIQYCRNSDRPDIGQCMTDAYADCPGVISEPYGDLFSRQKEMLSQGLAYLCSKAETIETNEVCLGRNSRSVRECEMNASRRMSEERSQFRFDTLSWEEQRPFIERITRSIEECVYDLVKTGCNTEIANVIGNFIYAISTYMYE